MDRQRETGKDAAEDRGDAGDQTRDGADGTATRDGESAGNDRTPQSGRGTPTRYRDWASI